jgi:putative phosphoribosyl transferase
LIFFFIKNIHRQRVPHVVNELKQREVAYRAASPHVSGKTIILVDDGIATGSTMRAAIAALGQQCPSKLVVAVPTAPPLSCDELRRAADEVVVVMMPERFYAVGEWYENFNQTSDEEVRELFERSRLRNPSGRHHTLGEL